MVQVGLPFARQSEEPDSLSESRIVPPEIHLCRGGRASGRRCNPHRSDRQGQRRLTESRKRAASWRRRNGAPAWRDLPAGTWGYRRFRTDLGRACRKKRTRWQASGPLGIRSEVEVQEFALERAVMRSAGGSRWTDSVDLRRFSP